MANETITFGGVQLNKGEVYKTRTVKDPEGKTRYVVTFNNGVQASYTGGKKNASIVATDSAAETKILKTPLSTDSMFWGVMGLEISGTSSEDHVSVINCSVINVNLAGDDYRTKPYSDTLHLIDSKKELGKNAIDGDLINARSRRVFDKTHYGDIQTDKNDKIIGKLEK